MSDGETVLESGTAHSHRFEVRHIRDRHFCGYVRTNFGSEWHYEDLRGHMSSLIEVHGGLTYGVDEDGWVGFDCAHAGDICVLDSEEEPDEADLRDRDTVWTVEDVAAECRKLARQVDVLETFADTFEERSWGHDGDE